MKGSLIKIVKDIENSKLIKTKRGIEYYNYAASMDTETSSFYNDRNEKVALMYVHQWNFNDIYFYGRTMEQFTYVLDYLSEHLGLNENKRLVIYVQNLSYDFQFFRKNIHIDNVFSVNSRTPIKVLTNGIELRDSYILSNKSLAGMGEEIGLPKLVGDLDYSKVRTPITPLTETEKGYNKRDVDILTPYIRNKMKEDGNITKIPMTSTGYVRNYVRKQCYKKGNYTKYRKLMEYLTLSADEYKLLKRAFAGGFTHANPKYIGITIIEKMFSYDLTSSYPTVMLSEKFPMSKVRYARVKSVSDLEYLFKDYCCVFDIQLDNVYMKKDVPDNILSKSKCWNVTGSLENNGRIVSADSLCVSITNVDFEQLKLFYDFDVVKIGKVACYKKGYLPKPIIECILEFYRAKTELKNKEGYEKEYALKKALLNAIYGMIVTDIIRDEITYENDEWGTEKADINKQIDYYNNSKNRFLFYPWGVFVTAYARKNLYSAVLNAGDNYVYSDTDSVKFIADGVDMSYFETYNNNIINKVKECLKYHNIEYIEYKDIENVPHPIGIWDFDGEYRKFKTLGAKRYIAEEVKKNGIKNIFTVSGIKKEKGIRGLSQNWNDDIDYENAEICVMDFDKFTHNFELSPEQSGKQTHTYIDEERKGIVTDYLGNEYEYDVLSSVHIEPQKATITISEEFEQYFLSIQSKTV